MRAIDHQNAVAQPDIRLHHDGASRCADDDDRLGTFCLLDLDRDIVRCPHIRDPRSHHNGVFAEA
ncbi:hypothetical protein [uncultured Methylobacterium sp.]|uniref:hypothetical protein n=1 Tax=uncultured Methylobacterium sp. TaxID=157278 RepID=UPI0035CBC0B6